ncbi:MULTISPECIES: hypothetical protein [Empedobacter]|uniref:hypothetical protein n=1 Tax=Empedobacter TaxID=59734 RepID=UPI000E9B30BA|nr:MULTISPECIES: hypothetical protein [Empedobacter]MBW1618643.1 hypothetical protein [Empedobacter falsenii]HBX62227.1 hypothetical protein [Flavobacteriaceae bacterium]
METPLKIIAFSMLIFPTIYQGIAGFRTKDAAVVKKVAWRAVLMQIMGTLLAYFIFIKIGQDKQVAIYVGFMFFTSVAILVLIQNILIYLKNNSNN